LTHRSTFVPTLVRALFPNLTRARVGGWCAGIGLTATLLWLTPLSPTALGHADAALGVGSPETAAARYDRVAAVNPFPWVRQEALYRGAMVRAVDLDEPALARQRLQRLAEYDLPPARMAEVQETIGQLLRDRESRPADAARAFLAAYEAAPDDQRAPIRLMAAARARGEAGEHESAAELWAKVAKAWPERAGEADLARGELALAAGDPKTALAYFEAAQPELHASDQIAMARLGAATCLERLGDLEGALAEFDGVADVPPDIVKSRTESLRARMSSGGSL
jgi:tetratricopeptide (TPR) repeat protein